MCLIEIFVGLNKLIMSDSRIIIIGAGAAGIAAATKLHENGFHNITILEGENRIGGRINTIPFGDSVIDVGAQFCHGAMGNVAYELANPHNLIESSKIYSNNDGFDLMWSTGEKVDRKKSLKLNKLVYDIAENSEECAKHEGSFGSYMLEK